MTMRSNRGVQKSYPSNSPYTLWHRSLDKILEAVRLVCRMPTYDGGTRICR